MRARWAVVVLTSTAVWTLGCLGIGKDEDDTDAGCQPGFELGADGNCYESGDDDDDDDVPTGDDDDDVVDTATDPGPTPGDDDDDSDTPPDDDTALALASYVGEGVLSNGGAYTGVESFRVVGMPTGAVLCDWQYEATGVPTAVVEPCRDADDRPCTFAIDVTLDGGHEVDGDCFDLFGTTPDVDGGGPYSYGYTANYYSGGTGYGPVMLYYFASYGLWYIVADASFDNGTRTFEYDWPYAYYPYVP